MRVLVFGASGMLGHAMMKVLAENADWQVFGTLRSDAAKKFFPAQAAERLLTGIDVDSPDLLQQAFARAKPDVVINCIGLVKQLSDANDPLVAIPVNAILPHRLAQMCGAANARLVHISTDCVFNGAKGAYTEDDPSDAEDLYGKSKFLGEVDYPHAITLRTSIIGHELQGAQSLLEWFLSQQGSCKGYTRAVFSGVPTVELARIVRDFVIPHPELSGLYHVAARPIAKYDLLKLIAKQYEKTIDIVPDEKLVIDRSLNAARFQKATGYIAPDWPDLIQSMHSSR
jgi:dTDP-4-dehydrorhamnose reductase